MKLTKNPTNVLYIKANTDSDWDTCEFVILTLDDNFKQWVTNVNKIVNRGLKTGVNNFYKLSCWCRADVWGKSISTHPLESREARNSWWVNTLNEIKELVNEQGFVYVEDFDENYVVKTEGTIDAQTINFFGNGRVNFSGYNDTTEEYYTEEIDIIQVYKNIGKCKKQTS